MCRASTSATEVGLQQSTFCTQMASALPNHTNGTMAKNTPSECIDLVC
uniref:Unidentified orf n=1 Tax=Human herpesvirus 8 TaxID=37296 RepID=Q98156_HHV8|nr:unidentified orf [Human gammaherpesvirus 8]